MKLAWVGLLLFSFSVSGAEIELWSPPASHVEVGAGGIFLPLFLVYLKADANVHVRHPIFSKYRLEHLINVGASGGSGRSYKNQRFATSLVIPFSRFDVHAGIGVQHDEVETRDSKGATYGHNAISAGLEAGFNINLRLGEFPVQVRFASIYQPLVLLTETSHKDYEFHRSALESPYLPTLDIVNISAVIQL